MIALLVLNTSNAGWPEKDIAVIASQISTGQARLALPEYFESCLYLNLKLSEEALSSNLKEITLGFKTVLPPSHRRDI